MLVLCQSIHEAKTRYNAKISPKKRFPKINGFDSGGRGGGCYVWRVRCDSLSACAFFRSLSTASDGFIFFSVVGAVSAVALAGATTWAVGLSAFLFL